MNNEIKRKIKGYVYNEDDEKKILDYITNLQEEKDDYKHKFWEEQELNEYLQDRIKKAIEYIKQCSWSNGIDNEIQYSLHVPTLLEILQGKSDE